MKRFSSVVAVAFLTLTAASLSISEGATLQRAQIARVSRVNAAAATSFSAEVPVVARVQGTSFFRTSIDINNSALCLKLFWSNRDAGLLLFAGLLLDALHRAGVI